MIRLGRKARLKRVLHRYMLQHAHPAKFLAECLGSLFAGYFLWQHQWVWAAVASGASFLVSSVVLWRRPIEGLSPTPLGRAMLVYATPLNFVFYNLSAVPLAHAGSVILAGVLVLLLPQFWGRTDVPHP